MGLKYTDVDMREDSLAKDSMLVFVGCHAVLHIDISHDFLDMILHTYRRNTDRILATYMSLSEAEKVRLRRLCY